ncbi:hypothetical protein QL285_075429 [Trifolium repens]|nr:hypothetical protein QL285_075429 [Trifolium repens]
MVACACITQNTTLGTTGKLWVPLEVRKLEEKQQNPIFCAGALAQQAAARQGEDLRSPAESCGSLAESCGVLAESCGKAAGACGKAAGACGKAAGACGKAAGACGKAAGRLREPAGRLREPAVACSKVLPPLEKSFFKLGELFINPIRSSFKLCIGDSMILTFANLKHSLIHSFLFVQEYKRGV